MPFGQAPGGGVQQMHHHHHHPQQGMGSPQAGYVKMEGIMAGQHQPQPQGSPFHHAGSPATAQSSFLFSAPAGSTFAQMSSRTLWLPS